jgi:AraC-like DNA-binding protein
MPNSIFRTNSAPGAGHRRLHWGRCQAARAGSLYVQDEHIQKVLAYIDEHIRSKLPRSQIAAAADLSDFYFSRVFRPRELQL